MSNVQKTDIFAVKKVKNSMKGMKKSCYNLYPQILLFYHIVCSSSSTFNNLVKHGFPQVNYKIDSPKIPSNEMSFSTATATFRHFMNFSTFISKFSPLCSTKIPKAVPDGPWAPKGWGLVRGDLGDWCVLGLSPFILETGAGGRPRATPSGGAGNPCFPCCCPMSRTFWHFAH